MPVDFDPQVARLSRWFFRTTFLVGMVPYALVVVPFWIVLRSVGLVPALASAVVYYLLVTIPWVVFRVEATLETDRTPDQVHEDFMALASPITGLWLPRADAVHEPPADSAAAAVVQRTSLWVVTRMWELVVDRVDDDRIRVQVRRDDAVPESIDLTIRPVDGGTEVDIERVAGPVSPAMCVGQLVQGPFERRMVARFGYHVRVTHLALTLRRPSFLRLRRWRPG